MRGQALISLMAGLGTLAGCTLAPAPPRAGRATPEAPEVSLFFIEGRQGFSVFVAPGSIPEPGARALARRKGAEFCRAARRGREMRITRIKRRSWAVPDAWQIDGTCA